MTTKNPETLAELLESDFLHCVNCSYKYQTPRILPCLHSFCEKCIDKFPRETTVVVTKGDKSDSGDDTENEKTEHLICPVCRSAVGIHENGVQEFSSNGFLSNLCELYNYKHEDKRTCEYCVFDGKTVVAVSLCLDCHDDMCNDCAEAHRKTKVTRGHKVIPFKQIKNGLYDHDIREYQHQKCVDHTKNRLTSFGEKSESLLCMECKSTEQDGHKTIDFESALPKYKQQIDGLLSGIENREPSINKYVQFLSTYLDSLDETKQKLLSNMENHANVLHKMIDECKNDLQNEVTEKCETEKREVQGKIGNLETAAKSLRNNRDYLSRLLAFGKSDEILTLHSEITFRLTQLVHMQLDGINNKLRMDFNPGCSSEQNVQTLFGKLNLDKMPIGKKESSLIGGRQGLSITSVLPNVKNSVELVMSFDADGSDDNRDVWPTGIAMTKQGDIVIVDRDNKKIKIFDESGKRKTEFNGGKEHKLGTPFDSTVLHTGDIAVTDYETEKVKVFTSTGNHVFTIDGFFKHPRGITTNSKGEILVVDCRKLQITVHDPKTGNLVKTIECKDETGSKILVDPYYITVSHDDNILVTDTAAPNIKVFGPNGKYLAQYGSYGTKQDQILQPYGVCTDDYGYMFVADNQNHRVHLLLPDGKFSKFLLTKNDSIWHPMATAINGKGYFVVTEALGKVRQYRYI